MDSERLRRKLDFLEHKFRFTQRDSRILFWFVGIFMVTPTLTFIYYLPISLLVSPTMMLLGVSTEKGSKIGVAAGIAICLLTSFASYYYLWKMFIGRKTKKPQ